MEEMRMETAKVGTFILIIAVLAFKLCMYCMLGCCTAC